VEYARDVERQLAEDGVRVSVSERDTLNSRIREAEVNKIPYMAVVGGREAEAGTVALRKRGAGRKQEVVKVAALRELLGREIRERTLG
jgi:threonyl-tRNA synthetase